MFVAEFSLVVVVRQTLIARIHGTIGHPYLRNLFITECFSRDLSPKLFFVNLPLENAAIYFECRHLVHYDDVG